MKIEDNLLGVSKVMFQNRKDWKHITDDQKEKYFFIFNRFFSKKYLYESQLLNNKSIDKVAGLNLWFHFLSDKPYPKWFWSKSKKSEDNKLSRDDFKFLLGRFELNKEEDLNFLIDRYPELIEEELKLIKKNNKI